jgi:DNA-binding CsgD family transcriptional regulator
VAAQTSAAAPHATRIDRRTAANVVADAFPVTDVPRPELAGAGGLCPYDDRRIFAAVVALRERDVRGALEFVRAAGAVTGPDPFPVELLSLLRQVVPSQAISWHEWSVEGMQHRQTISSNAPALTAEVWEGYAQFRHQDPLPGGCEGAPAPPPRLVGRTLKHSDFVSDRAFRRLDLYAYVCRPLEIDHVMKLFLPVADGVARCLVLDRTGTDFSERDRSVVDLLQPHLVQLEQAGRLRRIAETLAGAPDSRRAVVLLNRAGRIELVTADASRLLSRYGLRPRGTRLPHVVAEWVDVRREPGTLRVEGGGRRLAVGSVEEDGRRVLILSEELTGTAALTPREREVLALVSEGRSNGQIAASLCIASGTVRKHLENVYAKLGVTNRTAAVARSRP